MNAIPLFEVMPVIDERQSPGDNLIEDVTVIFSDITRYPTEIIDPHADLETDLGIDSVKFGEIFAALRERYALPSQDFMKTLPPERFRSVAAIADLIGELRGMASNDKPPAPVVSPAPVEPPAANETASAVLSPAVAPPAVAPPAAVLPVAAVALPSAAAPAAAADTALLAEITRIFADMTRYPAEILDADADFENDLGIDSVKLGEIFAVLRDKYHLPPPEILRDHWEPDAIRTIRGITDGIASLQAVSAPANAGVPKAQQPVVVVPSVAPLGKFAGKIALITGSGRGLGRELALHLGNLGATVLVNSFHSREAGEATVEEIRQAGGSAHHLWASVANNVQLNKMFDTIETQFGGLDFLISNASNGLLAPLDMIQPEHWEKALRTNVIGLHQCALRARPLMKARGGGRIITMSSVAAHRYVDYFGCMGPMKAAVESLTKFLAVEFQPDNILVNCVSAGAVYGELVEKWPDRDRLLPLWEAGAGGRLCTGADVANFVEYLLGDGASMMNGSILIMDGGQTARG
ncbi:MAG TPA: SDR family oxidoreductase [Stellaceae bacterium]|jgi:NAD(P)-dependent dehydrogenase (short-subunit alcohol dehydrogenase family)/acyl carrier protein|nr:SDR family oxidoreductase [Stellaceae bacterium]